MLNISRPVARRLKTLSCRRTAPTCAQHGSRHHARRRAQDPADSTRTVGSINLTIQSSTLQNLEHQFWGRVLGIADLNGDGELSLEEFVMLMQASRVRMNGGNAGSAWQGWTECCARALTHRHDLFAILKRAVHSVGGCALRPVATLLR